MKKLRSGLLKALISLTILLVSAEVGLRLAGYANGPSQYYDPQIGFRFYPNQERWLLGPKGERLADVHTNELGYRGPWYAGEKPEGTLRIACLGDSFTFGWGVQGEDAYPIQLEGLLAEREAQVYNLGVPGYNTRNELNTYVHHARGLDPDVVILGFFLNDLQPDGGGPRYTDSWLAKMFGRTALLDAFHKHLRARIPLFDSRRTPELKRQLKVYRENYRTVQEHPEDELSRPYWAEVTSALDELVAEVRADDVRFLLVAFPSKPQVNEVRDLLRSNPGEQPALDADTFATQRVLATRASELGIPYLDLLMPFARAKGNMFGSIDKNHPGPAGYRTSAEHVLSRLEELGYL